MSIRADLDRLLEIQALDSEHDAAVRSKTQIDTGAKAEAAMNAAQTGADAAHTAASLTSRNLKDAELELASVETKYSSYEQRMRSGKVTNSKEIANFEKEMHQLSRQRSTLDDKILNLMEQTEKDQATFGNADSQLRAASQALTDQRELSQKVLDRLNGVIDRTSAARSSLAECMDGSPIYAKYAALRAKPSTGGLAVVRIDSDRHCGGCHLPVSQQYAERVKEADALVTCENCGRILA